MRMLQGFGQLLLNVRERLKRQGDNSGNKVIGKVSTLKNNKVLIWGVMEGPYHISDFPEEELDDVLDGFEWMLVCKIEEEGSLGLVNYWYPTLEEALAVKWYFDKNIEPLEVNND